MRAGSGHLADSTAPGYPSAQYAYALAEFGGTRQLPLYAGGRLDREIPGARPPIGVCPVIACRDWQRSRPSSSRSANTSSARRSLGGSTFPGRAWERGAFRTRRFDEDG